MKHLLVVMVSGFSASAQPSYVYAQQQQSDAITRERNACVTAATAKFKLQTEGQVASYATWRAELKQCEDLMLSRLAARQLHANCALKWDWVLRYQMMLYDADQKAMAEDRYAEICQAGPPASR